MNGKFKSCVSVFLLYVFISISSVFPVFADDFVTTPIPDYVESTVNPETAEEVAVLGTLAQLITDGTTFDFSSFNGSYADFIDSIYNLSPLYLWDYGFNQVNNLITEIDNQIPALRWLDNMFGLGPFETISGVVNEKYKGVFNRFNQDNEEVPSPPSDYTSYIQLINGDSGSGHDDFWWRDFQQYYPYGGETPQYLNYPLYTKSYRFRSGTGTSASNRPIRCYDLTSIYIIWNDSIQKYETTITTQTCPNFLSIGFNNTPSTSVYSSDSTSFGNTSTVIYGNYNNNTSVESYSTRYENATITGMLTTIASNWRNVNIYVDGVPWAIVGDTSSYYYVDPNGLKYEDTELNVKVNYPDNTYFDFNTLKQIIQDIIDNKDVLTYNDIKPVFVDYNGQQAIAVYNVNTNPTDIDISIQYPSGTPNFDEFSQQFEMISNTTEPAVYLFGLVNAICMPELWEILIFAGVLFLFCCIIKRMLE